MVYTYFPNSESDIVSEQAFQDCNERRGTLFSQSLLRRFVWYDSMYNDRAVSDNDNTGFHCVVFEYNAEISIVSIYYYKLVKISNC